MSDALDRARECAAGLRRSLLRWFDAEARDLPWRRTKDPYAVWLSEIILQQTRVEQGLPYFERFIDAFPTVHDLANAPEERVLKLWEGLGYYSRARNLHKAAKNVSRERGGQFPDKAAGLETLPGVGRYTAGAIASIAFGERVPVVDGNVIRVLARLFDVAESTDATATKHHLWALAETLVPPKRPGDFNEAMMELGARVCTPRQPACEACPVRRYCLAAKRGTQLQRPVRKPKATTPHYEMVAAVVKRNGRYLIAKRPDDGLLGGLWEFPATRVARGESHEQSVARLLGELGLTGRPGGLMASVKHAYSHFRITLNAYACSVETGEAGHPDYARMKWLFRAKLDEHAFPKAALKILAHIDS